MASTTDDKTKKIPERPIDPSRNASDIMDVTGLTGITSGSPQQTSAEPDDVFSEGPYEPGGILGRTKNHNPYGIPEESENDKIYKENMLKGMSNTAAQFANSIASTKDGHIPDPLQSPTNTANVNDDQADINLDTVEDVQTISSIPPSIQGEQSVSGDMPDVESDDDTLENAHQAGFQLDEDLEHPQEINIARDIDAAEEDLRTH